MMDGLMRTALLPANAASIDRAAFLLQAGEVVAFPTETVYGLGADALNESALPKIFAAKGRPSDNPLIAHISSMDMISALTDTVDARFLALCRAFWPGPLTVIVKRKKGVPDLLSAGLPTVAIRMPRHPVARALIDALGKPIAAPSANRSGKPSPTTAEHVLFDLSGKIPLILDGGPSELGLESTVIDLTSKTPTILRPGSVTEDMLRRALPDVLVDDGVLRRPNAHSQAKSPGMKHRHYAPEARVIVVEGAPESVARKCLALYDQAMEAGQKPVLLNTLPLDAAGRDALFLGKDARDMAARFYDALRSFDVSGYSLIIAQAVTAEGVGLALMNRLLRAADFDRVQA